MTIDHNEEVESFGTPVVVSSSSSLVANTGFSVDADTISFGNRDNAIYANAVLTFTPSAITTAGDTINLYASLNAIDGVNNENFPSANNKKHLLGEFIVDASAAAQSVSVEIPLNNVKSGQGYEFAIENLLTTVSINAGWTLTVTPKAVGPN
jgi:hypothetical protein